MIKTVSNDKLRLSVFRSNQYLFAQIIDGQSGKTVLGVSEQKLLGKTEDKKTKTQRAFDFGVLFGKNSVEKNIKKVVFDRGEYRFHGRIKAFAEGVKKGGLEF